MFYLNDAVDNFVSLLGGNTYFDSINIIKAFGADTVETLPDKVYIAVGLGEIHFTGRSAGQDVKAGEVQIFADIYVPYTIADSAPPVQDILSEICSSIAENGVVSVYAGRPYADKNTRCTVTESAFTFNDLIYFGEVQADD